MTNNVTEVIRFLEECLDKGGVGDDELYAWYCNNVYEIREAIERAKDE